MTYSGGETSGGGDVGVDGGGYTVESAGVYADERAESPTESPGNDTYPDTTDGSDTEGPYSECFSPERDGWTDPSSSVTLPGDLEGYPWEWEQARSGAEKWTAYGEDRAAGRRAAAVQQERPTTRAWNALASIALQGDRPRQRRGG